VNKTGTLCIKTELRNPSDSGQYLLGSCRFMSAVPQGFHLYPAQDRLIFPYVGKVSRLSETTETVRQFTRAQREGD
jgi:hypothetical protein